MWLMTIIFETFFTIYIIVIIALTYLGITKSLFILLRITGLVSW